MSLQEWNKIILIFLLLENKLNTKFNKFYFGIEIKDCKTIIKISCFF